jgi:hypothetical protein
MDEGQPTRDNLEFNHQEENTIGNITDNNISSSQNAGNSSNLTHNHGLLVFINNQFTLYTPNSYQRNWNNLDNKAFIRERTLERGEKEYPNDDA